MHRSSVASQQPPVEERQPQTRDQTKDLLQAVTGLLSRKYARADPSLYLHGSRRNGSNHGGSDLDVTVVLRDDTWQAHVRNDLENLGLEFTLALDASVYTVDTLNAPEAGYEAGRLLNASELISGRDIQPQVRNNYIAAAHRHRVVEQARKGSALIRGLDVVPDILNFPDRSSFSYGYEVVRKPS